MNEIKKIRCENPVVDSILFKALKSFQDISGDMIEKNQHWADWAPSGEIDPNKEIPLHDFFYRPDEVEVILIRELPKSNKTDRFISDMMQAEYGDMCPGDGMCGSHK